MQNVSEQSKGDGRWVIILCMQQISMKDATFLFLVIIDGYALVCLDNESMILLLFERFHTVLGKANITTRLKFDRFIYWNPKRCVIQFFLNKMHSIISMKGKFYISPIKKILKFQIFSNRRSVLQYFVDYWSLATTLMAIVKIFLNNNTQFLLNEVGNIFIHVKDKWCLNARRSIRAT